MHCDRCECAPSGSRSRSSPIHRSANFAQTAEKTPRKSARESDDRPGTHCWLASGRRFSLYTRPGLQQFRLQRLIPVTRAQDIRSRIVQIEDRSVRRDVLKPHPQIEIRHVRRNINLRVNRPGHFRIRGHRLGIEYQHILASGERSIVMSAIFGIDIRHRMRRIGSEFRIRLPANRAYRLIRAPNVSSRDSLLPLCSKYFVARARASAAKHPRPATRSVPITKIRTGFSRPTPLSIPRT